jgi:hypothetical protein
MAKAKRVHSTPRRTAPKIPPLTAVQNEPAEYPVSIFGKLPVGFTLEQEKSVHQLAYWHSKTQEVMSELDYNDDVCGPLYDPAQDRAGGPCCGDAICE